jgi:hypothetical protein
MNEDYSDHELTRLAAKAAGYKWVKVIDYKPLCHQGFNPLGDDGEVFRLAVHLKIDLIFLSDSTGARHIDLDESIYVDHMEDPYAATRRAVVMVAAEIERRKQSE